MDNQKTYDEVMREMTSNINGCCATITLTDVIHRNTNKPNVAAVSISVNITGNNTDISPAAIFARRLGGMLADQDVAEALAELGHAFILKSNKEGDLSDD